MIYKIQSTFGKSKDAGYMTIQIDIDPYALEVSLKAIRRSSGGAYREDFIIPPGHNELEIKVWGHIDSSFEVSFFLDDGGRVCHTYHMVNYGPSQLYRLTKLLINEHKCFNPSMLQSKDD